MEKWVHVLDGKYLDVVESEDKPDWPPYFNTKTRPQFIQLTKEVEALRVAHSSGIRNNFHLFTIMLINDCNRRCSYCPCGAWNEVRPEDYDLAVKNGYPSPGSPNQITNRVLLPWIKRHIDPCTTVLELTGGEPGMYDGIFELVKTLNDWGYSGIIRTNGDWPLPKTPNFDVVMAWHDNWPLKPKHLDLSSTLLIMSDCPEKIEYAKAAGLRYKIIHKEKIDTTDVENPLEQHFQHWGYMYSCGQLSAGNGCGSSDYSLHEHNIHVNSAPRWAENPCESCNSVKGYEFVKSFLNIRFPSDVMVMTSVCKDYVVVEHLLKDKVVMDIGSHNGYFADWALYHGAKVVHCYEPFMGVNPIYHKNKVWYYKGILDSSRQEYLHIYESHPCNNSVVTEGYDSKELCEFASFEEELEKVSPDFIKCDIEGAEKFLDWGLPKAEYIIIELHNLELPKLLENYDLLSSVESVFGGWPVNLYKMKQ